MSVINKQSTLDFTDLELDDISMNFGNKLSKDFLFTVKIISRKWNLIVLFHLHKNPFIGFNELKKLIDKNLSSNSLSRTLQELLSFGLIEKRNVPGISNRVEYFSLVSGKDLSNIFSCIQNFAKSYNLA